MSDPQKQQSPPPPGSPDSDNGNQPSRDNRPPVKLQRPPLQTFIVWMVILFALPLIIIFVGNRHRGETTKMLQSEFEDYLRAGKITSAVVTHEPGTGIGSIRGTFIRKIGEPGEKVEEFAYETKVTYSDTLDALVREHCPEYNPRRANNFWSQLLVSLLPILLLVAVIYFLFSRQLKAAGRGALQFGKSKARLMPSTQETVTFEDVAGIDEAKEDVQEIVEYLRSPEKFQRIGGRIPKGVLMVGPPGTGKTLLARAISGEAGVPFFSISGSDFVEMFVGVGASRVRDMFEEGKRHAPCLIFIDEIDAVGRSRFSGIGGGHDEREQTLNALLSEMDGFEANTGVIVLAATNRPDVLDPALMRPGRFDRRIAVDLPDVEGRLGILQIHAKSVKTGDNCDFGTVARGTPGFSGADLANLINEAALAAAKAGKKSIEMEDLEEARDKVRWGKERRSRVLDEHERAITAYHEAGHALVSLNCEHSMPLHKVTIVPRGSSYLGATMSLPDKERYTRSKAELADELAILLGGRLAEKIIFSDVTTGAAMDLRQATDIARRMVCEWGMSEHLGPLAYGHREEHIYLGRDITRSQDYSEETAREIDQEVRQILMTAEQRSAALLEEHTDQLKLLGETLLVKETLSAREIRILLGVATPEDRCPAEEPEKPPVVPADEDTESAGEADGEPPEGEDGDEASEKPSEES